MVQAPSPDGAEAYFPLSQRLQRCNEGTRRHSGWGTLGTHPQLDHAVLGSADEPQSLARVPSERRSTRQRSWRRCGRAEAACRRSLRGGVTAGAPPPHLRRDWARPAHICAGTGLAPINICAGTATGPSTMQVWRAYGVGMSSALPIDLVDGARVLQHRLCSHARTHACTCAARRRGPSAHRPCPIQLSG
jgi:hypothetical protein